MKKIINKIVKTTDVEATLDDYGEKGWEAWHMVKIPHGNGFEDEYVIYFKRRVKR